MKKYIIPVAAFLLIGTIASAQTEKKQPSKMATTKPMAKPATGAGKTAKPVVDSTAKHSTTGAAIKRKTHTKPVTTDAKKTGTK